MFFSDWRSLQLASDQSFGNETLITTSNVGDLVDAMRAEALSEETKKLRKKERELKERHKKEKEELEKISEEQKEEIRREENMKRESLSREKEFADLKAKEIEIELDRIKREIEGTAKNITRLVEIDVFIMKVIVFSIIVPAILVSSLSLSEGRPLFYIAGVITAILTVVSTLEETGITRVRWAYRFWSKFRQWRGSARIKAHPASVKEHVLREINSKIRERNY